MRWCTIELSIKCPRCDASVHVDSPRQTMVCGKCMSEIDFPDHLKCMGYGTVMAIREAPPWFRTAVPRVKLVVGGYFNTRVICPTTSG